MNEKHLRALLEKHRAGKLETDALVRELHHLPFEDLGFAKVDHHRAMRCGFPEVIYCEGKTPAQVGKIAKSILSRGHLLLGTRAGRAAYRAVHRVTKKAVYHETARCITVGEAEPAEGGEVLVVCAGTSDLPVAEEAYVTAKSMGADVRLLSDVGVAGVHRLLGHVEMLMEASVLIVVAGMEGALASVVGGLVNRPVVAVPTSVGYGASFGGVAPLLTMLNSCAAGISVVNIDNGFGAGYLSALMVKELGNARRSGGEGVKEKGCGSPKRRRRR